MLSLLLLRDVSCRKKLSPMTLWGASSLDRSKNKINDDWIYRPRIEELISDYIYL